MHWRHEFPFLFRLFGQSDKAHPDNYFSLVDQDWRSPLAQNSYRVWNTRLSRLDPVSFVDLVRRAAPYVSKREITTGRHWTGLFEILNEAKGYTHLLDLGYDDVGFIPPASCYTPDLRGTGSPGDALLEVKTVNISDQDIQLFGTIQKARHGLPEGLQQELASDFDKACEQLHSIPASDPVRRICYFCITLDLGVVLSDANKAELHNSLMSLQDRDCDIHYESQHWTAKKEKAA